MNIEAYDVRHSTIYSNLYDLRRDLHTYIEYVRGRDIKRAHRTNALPKADTKRLAKLLSYPHAVAEITKTNKCQWLNDIEALALRLGFVSYDIKGSRTNVSNYNVSYPDNYIIFNDTKYKAYMQFSMLVQEKHLLQLMLDDPQYNEFYERHWQSQLRGFTISGRALGAMPLLKIPASRQILFNHLSKLKSGIWYDVASFIVYLKQVDPYFLIPKRLPLVKRFGRSEQPTRYGNFYESPKGLANLYASRNTSPISDDAIDGFERVEGRFVERFLEGIPLTLNYVDVAYQQGDYTGIMPEKGHLKAFRLHEHFLQILRNELPAPRVIVQPSFDIILDAPFYSPKIMHQLLRFAELVSEDTVTILKLEKQRVKATVAAETGLDVVAELSRLTGRALPSNIVREIKEWSGQAEAFTLYTGYSLFEGNLSDKDSAEFTCLPISKSLHIIKKSQKLLNHLRKNEHIPLQINHLDAQFTPLPTEVHSKFPLQKKTKAKPKPKGKPRITTQRETSITLILPTKTAYTQFRTALIDERALFETDAAQLNITYNQSQQPKIDAALKLLKKTFTIKLQDRE